MHDHGQPTRQGHDRLFHPALPGDLHRPSFSLTILTSGTACSGPPRRASFASCRLRTLISHRFGRSRLIDPDTNFNSRGRAYAKIMDSSSNEELTGDFGSRPESTSTSDCR
jgi:hypothetical protein